MFVNPIAAIRSPKNGIALLSGYLFCVVLWGGGFVVPAVSGIQFFFPYNGRFLLFPYPALTTVWLIFSVLIPGITFASLLKLYKNGQVSRNKTPFLLLLAPLLLLPLSSALLVLRSQGDQHGLISQQLFANLFFYVPVLIFAYILCKIIEHLSRQDTADKRVGNTLIVLVGVFFFLFYWLVGYYFTLSCGEHSGDEGHYIVQAKSLYYDHDLELSNNLEPRALEYVQSGHKAFIHISPTARDGKLYSWHPFGLPLYLSLLPADNLLFRHLLLGFLAGLGSAGLMLLCRYLNVIRRSALLFVFLFSLSPLWGVYAVRVLPELPGAVFTIWTAVALCYAARHPWIAGLILTVCSGYLPFLHPRFALISLFGYLFFVFSFFSTQQLKKRWPVILAVTSGLTLFAVIFLYVNGRLYTTSSAYPSASAFLFSYVPGIWEVFTTRRSITYVLPSFAWMFSASLLLAFFGKEHRSYTFFTLFSFVAVLLVSCSYKGWTGGSSVMGRYLLVVCPLLLPLAAYSFDRTNRVARWWFIVLATGPVLQWFLMLARLPKFHSSFRDPRYSIGIVYDYLQGLLNPFSPVFTPFSLFDRQGYLFPLLLFVLTTVLIAHRRERRFLMAYPMIIIAAALYSHDPETSFTWDGTDKNRAYSIREKNAEQLMRYDFDRSYILSHKPARRVPLFEGSNRLAFFQGKHLAAITTEPARKGKTANLVFQPERAANDWTGKSYFWTTFGTRFQGSPGTTAFSLTGDLTGRVEAHLLIMEMGGEENHTLLDKKFNSVDGSLAINETSIIRPTGDGLVHILMRLSSGNGTFIGKTIGWSPVSEELLEKTMTFVSN